MLHFVTKLISIQSVSYIYNLYVIFKRVCFQFVLIRVNNFWHLKFNQLMQCKKVFRYTNFLGQFEQFLYFRLQTWRWILNTPHKRAIQNKVKIGTNKKQQLQWQQHRLLLKSHQRPAETTKTFSCQESRCLVDLIWYPRKVCQINLRRFYAFLYFEIF